MELNQKVVRKKPITVHGGTEMTPQLLRKLIAQHRAENTERLKLYNMYIGDHDILADVRKEQNKPDNRIVVNFAKYIVDTFNGYFIGSPIRTTHENEEIADYLEMLDMYSNQDDNNAELSKNCSIYGHAYELLYIDENSEVGITYFPPTEGFVVYDESVIRRRLYGVRYYKNSEGQVVGSFSDANSVTYFNLSKSDRGEENLIFEDTTPHYFGGVPIIEYVENEERQGIFENVVTLINAYDKALSEKGNDVDYYADAYLLILGALLNERQLLNFRSTRTINIPENMNGDVSVQFLEKPNADTTQENYIDRLEKLIFQIAMVANLNDQELTQGASGISLEWKTQNMSNLAKTKERKFTAGLNTRYQLISNVPASRIPSGEWMGIKYKFTRNMPKNLLEESQIAGNLAGITSHETQLSVISAVDNPVDELAKIKKEEDERAVALPARLDTEATGAEDGDAQ